MATKQFKIGEYAVGGIIKVDASLDSVTIQALDYNTKSVVQTQTFTLNRRYEEGKQNRLEQFEFLEERLELFLVSASPFGCGAAEGCR